MGLCAKTKMRREDLGKGPEEGDTVLERLEELAYFLGQKKAKRRF